MPKLMCLMALIITTAFTAGADNLQFSLQRHTYTEGDKSISIGMRNTEDIPYLIQANMVWLNEQTGISTLDKKTEGIPFIITPPLHKLLPDSYYDWRIIFSGNSNNLPDDRETLYLAKFLAIPPSLQKEPENIDISVLRAINFKIYYRPKSLASLKIAGVQDKISFRRDSNRLIIKNNSGIYLTLDTLKVGGVSVPDSELFKPLPPFSEQSFQLPENTPFSKTAEWNLLDEDAFPLDKQNSLLG